MSVLYPCLAKHWETWSGARRARSSDANRYFCGNLHQAKKEEEVEEAARVSEEEEEEED